MPPKFHPWRRFLARLMDYLIFGNLFVFVCFYFYPVTFVNYFNFTNIFSCIAIISFLWIFFESIIIYFFRNTLGKFLFRIDLSFNDKKEWTYFNCLKRSFLVWFLGIGMGIPILNLLAMMIAYRRLLKNNITIWDEKLNITISFKKFGVIRIVCAATIILILYLALDNDVICRWREMQHIIKRLPASLSQFYI